MWNLIRTGKAQETQKPNRSKLCGCMFECLRAGAGEAAQPTGRLPHQVHGPTISSQGKEHIIAHILVHVHLSLREEKADRWTNTNTHTHACIRATWDIIEIFKYYFSWAHTVFAVGVVCLRADTLTVRHVYSSRCRKKFCHIKSSNRWTWCKTTVPPTMYTEI